MPFMEPVVPADSPAMATDVHDSIRAVQWQDGRLCLLDQRRLPSEEAYLYPADAAEVASVRELYIQAVESLMNAGAFFSRPYGDIADIAYSRDGETAAALRKVKTIFDQNNVMNAGKLCF